MPTKQTESAPSFLQVYTQVRRDRMKHSFLRQISACVDWRGIRTLLNKKYTKTQNATGNPAYDALMMFKILLLLKLLIQLPKELVHNPQVGQFSAKATDGTVV